MSVSRNHATRAHINHHGEEEPRSLHGQRRHRQEQRQQGRQAVIRQNRPILENDDEPVNYRWIDVLADEAGTEAELNQFARDIGKNRDYIGDRPEIFERVLFACSSDDVDDNTPAMMAQFIRDGPFQGEGPHRCICGQTTYKFYIATNFRMENRVLIGSCCIHKWREDGAPNHYVTGGFVVADAEPVDDEADYQPSDEEEGRRRVRRRRVRRRRRRRRVRRKRRIKQLNKRDLNDLFCIYEMRGKYLCVYSSVR